jgi:hypothetical protein
VLSPKYNKIDRRSYEVLHEVVENDGQQDLRMGSQCHGGQDQPRAIIIHAETEHQRDPAVAVRSEDTRQQVPRNKGGDAERRGDHQHDRQKIDVRLGHRLGQRERCIRIVEQHQDAVVDEFQIRLHRREATLSDEPMREDAQQRRQDDSDSKKGSDASGGELMEIFGIIAGGYEAHGMENQRGQQGAEQRAVSPSFPRDRPTARWVYAAEISVPPSSPLSRR